MISKEFKNRVLTSIFLIFTLYFIIKFNLFLVFCLIIFGVLSILEFIKILNLIIKSKFILISLNIFFILYIFLFCLIFFYFSSIQHLKVMLFILLLTCIASDIGGYVIGKILKGPKITKISPKKTFSGALGSILFSIITLLVLIYYTLNIFDYKLILIAIITSSTNQLGDLLFSYLKRKAKIKNTGNFLPGHGGILDRLDGILIGLPIGYVSLIFVF